MPTDHPDNGHDRTHGDATGHANGHGGAPLDVKLKALYYGKFKAVRDVTFGLPARTITALVGPSGCGKSTVLRCMNRMNDLIRGARVEGEIAFRGRNIYDQKVDPVAVRRYIGMVSQQPNPFAMSIGRNVEFGLRLNRFRGNYGEKVEAALKAAALWDEVKDKLNESALSLSGGQQQRLCIARTIATEPEVILMDEPCSALDPVATHKIEELMKELKKKYTIAVVTHNIQQAKRVADQMAVFNVEDAGHGGRTGYLVEFGDAKQVFEQPKEKSTGDYLRGEFG